MRGSRSIIACFLLGACGLLFHDADSALAKGKGKDKPKVELKVKPGDTVADFKVADDAGETIKLADLIGKKVVVLFFYPSDFTGNAVAQVRGYEDELDNFHKAGAVVIGVSGDSVNTHQMFKKYYKLRFQLFADEKGDVAKAIGLAVGKGGKTPTIGAKDEKGEASRNVTLGRVTVVIDKAGKIAAIDVVPGSGKGASIGDDARRVLAIVTKLNAK